MSNFEGIIRPFETGDISPPKPVPTSPDAASTDNVTISVSGGSVKEFSGSYDLTVTYYYVKKPKEKPKGGSGGDISGGDNTTGP